MVLRTKGEEGSRISSEAVVLAQTLADPVGDQWTRCVELTSPEHADL